MSKVLRVTYRHKSINSSVCDAFGIFAYDFEIKDLGAGYGKYITLINPLCVHCLVESETVSRKIVEIEDK